MSLRIGFIGAGGIADAHLNTLSTREDATVVALCDINQQTAQAKVAQYGGVAYTDFRRMLDEQKLDAVFICTPPFAHGDLEMAAIERGLPLFIEKPIALDLDMARPILQAVQAADLTTLVAYKYRWDDHILRARELLADKTQGLLVGRYWTGMPGVPWWRVQAQSGGQMVEQTTHIVDMARFLGGEITHVQAFEAHQAMHTVYPDATAADAAVTNLRFASGAVGSISNTYMIAGGGTSGLEVIAHNFRLSVEGSVLRWWGKDEQGEVNKEVNGYVDEVDAFLHAVQTGDRSRVHSDYADAYRTLAVSAAANLSAQQGGAVIELAGLL